MNAPGPALTVGGLPGMLESFITDLETMPKHKLYRVILADDHPLLRESIATYIEDNAKDQISVVAQVGDGQSAVDMVAKHKPDLVLLDIHMPRLDGISALRLIKQASPDTLVLMLSMYEDQAHVVEAIRAGADDYLFKKNATSAHITNHMLSALGGELPVQDAMHKSLFQAIRGGQEGSMDTGLSKLTGAELEVLRRVAHKGLSMKEIAEELGGKEGKLSEHTVRKHLEHIYEKLGASGQAHAVALAIKLGFISAEDAEPSRDNP